RHRNRKSLPTGYQDLRTARPRTPPPDGKVPRPAAVAFPAYCDDRCRSAALRVVPARRPTPAGWESPTAPAPATQHPSSGETPHAPSGTDSLAATTPDATPAAAPGSRPSPPSPASAPNAAGTT